MTKIFQARSPQRRKMPESETKLKLNIQFQLLADTTPKIRSLQNVKVFEIPPAPPTPFGTSSFTYSPTCAPAPAAKCKQISNMQRMLVRNEKWNWNWTENSANDTWPTTFCYFFAPLKYFYDLLYVCAAQSKHAMQREELWGVDHNNIALCALSFSVAGANQSSSQLQFSA